MLQEYSPCNMTGCEHQLLRCCVNISNLKEFQGHGQTLSCIAYLCAPVRPMGIVPFSFCLPVPPTIRIANWYSEAQCPARVVVAALKSSQEIRTTILLHMYVAWALEVNPVAFVVQDEYVHITPDVHSISSARANEDYGCRFSQPQLCYGI